MNFTDKIKLSYQLLTNGNIKSAYDQIVNPATYRGGGAGLNTLGYQDNSMWMFGSDGEPDRLFTYTDKYSSLKAYTSCPPVSAIINKKAQAFVNGQTWITNVGGKANGKESTSPVAVKIRNLLTNPNKLQSGKQFEAQAYSLINLYGYCVVLAMKPFGYEKSDATSLWILPNWLLDVYQSREVYYQDEAEPIAKITFTYGGSIVNLPLDDIIILKDFTPCLTSPSLPSNRIEPLAYPINNVIGAYESRNVLINKRGPTGFLTQETNPLGNIPMSPKEKDEMQREFKQYGLRKGQIQVILGAAALKWQKIGFNVNELGLFEEVAESGIAICNGLSFPPFLLGLSDTTFNNQKEASRGLYQETIIPESQSIYEQWNTAFETKKYNIVITKDYSHVAALQEDRLLKAQSRKMTDEALEKEFKNNVITLNMWLIELDYDPRTDGYGDMYYYQLLKEGFVFGDTSVTGGDTKPTSETTTTTQPTN